MPTTLVPLLNFAAETALIIAAFLLVSLGFGPRLRLLVYRGLFATLLIAPVAVLIAVLQDGASSSAFEMITATAITPATVDPSSISAAWPGLTVSALEIAAVIWIAGAGLVLGRCLLSHLFLSRAFAAASPATDAQEARIRALADSLEVDAPVRTRFSPLVPTPCTFGWLRPKILLPASSHCDTMDCVITHELCHIRASDALWLTIERLACALYWFNPLIWLAASRHRNEIELVCDAAATETVISIEAYVEALVRIARDLSLPNRSAAAMMSQRGFRDRIRALLHRRRPMPAPSGAAKLGVLVFSGAAMFALGSGQIVSAREPDAPHSLATRNVPAEGNGLIFVDVARGIRVDVGETGACWDDAHCVFEHTLGEELTLRILDRPLAGIQWSGCEPSVDNSVCRVRIGQAPSRVSVRLRL